MLSLLRLLLLAGTRKKSEAGGQFAVRVADLLVSLQLITYPAAHSDHTITATITGLSVNLLEV